MTTYPPTDNGVFKAEHLSNQYFAEGIAMCGDYIYQLTWKENIILKYTSNLELVQTIAMDQNLGTGWGLAADGNVLYATNYSNKI
jgi:glutamine cyclotransferase